MFRVMLREAVKPSETVRPDGPWDSNIPAPNRNFATSKLDWNWSTLARRKGAFRFPWGERKFSCPAVKARLEYGFTLARIFSRSGSDANTDGVVMRRNS